MERGWRGRVVSSVEVSPGHPRGMSRVTALFRRRRVRARAWDAVGSGQRREGLGHLDSTAAEERRVSEYRRIFGGPQGTR
jgi:hypothetical protein